MSEAESNRFADPVVWVAVLIFLLLFYVLAYLPILLLFDSLFLGFPGGMSDFLEATIAPLSWLDEHSSIYASYLEFVSDIVY